MQETQETWVQSVSRKDPLEEEMAINSSTLAWEIPCLEPTNCNYGSPHALQPMLCNKRSHSNEKPVHRNWRGAPAHCFPGGSVVKNPHANARDTGSISGPTFPGEGNGKPLQISCLGNPMDSGAWQATVPGVAKSQTRLSEHTCTTTIEKPGQQ